MRVITTEITKSLLGITEDTYDDAIELKIPYIDSLVKRITKNKFTVQVVGTLTSGSKTVLVSQVYASHGIAVYNAGQYDSSIDDVLYCGQLLEGDGIPTGTYITDIASFALTGSPSISISVSATASGSVAFLTGIPVDLQQVIAKGIWYLIENDSTIIKDDTWTSRSMGPMSVSRNSMDSKVNTYGMPLWFVKAIPTFQSGY